MRNTRPVSIPAESNISITTKTSHISANSRLMAKYKYHVVIRDYSSNQDGSAPLLLDVNINGVRRRPPIGVYVAPKFFNKKTGLIDKSHPYASDWNLIIRNELARANNIFVRYKLSDRILNMNTFLTEFTQGEDKRNDFISFFEGRLKQRLRRKDIDPESHRFQQSKLNTLKEFHPVLNFHELTPDVLKGMQVKLQEKDKQPWTIWGFFKTIKTYTNLAKTEGIVFEDPFKRFKIGTPKSKHAHLNETEIATLFKYFHSEGCLKSHQKVLRCFLFSCLTGLRISDVQRITHDHIVNGELHFIPHKGRRKGKLLELPLNDEIRSLIITDTGKIFETLSDQYTNRLLKDIAKKCEIKKSVTFHSGRHTFGFLASKLEVPLLVLKDLMGHAKIQTTMIYSHIEHEQKVEGMQRMQGLLIQRD